METNKKKSSRCPACGHMMRENMCPACFYVDLPDLCATPEPAAERPANLVDEFVQEVAAACTEAGTTPPDFVANHQPGDTVLYRATPACKDQDCPCPRFIRETRPCTSPPPAVEAGASERERQIRERLRLASPGPWKVDPAESGPNCGLIYADGDLLCQVFGNGYDVERQEEYGEYDVDLIANAPTDLEWLLAKLEASRAALEDTRNFAAELQQQLAEAESRNEALAVRYEDFKQRCRTLDMGVRQAWQEAAAARGEVKEALQALLSSEFAPKGKAVRPDFIKGVNTAINLHNTAVQAAAKALGVHLDDITPAPPTPQPREAAGGQWVSCGRCENGRDVCGCSRYEGHG